MIATQTKVFSQSREEHSLTLSSRELSLPADPTAMTRLLLFLQMAGGLQECADPSPANEGLAVCIGPGTEPPSLSPIKPVAPSLSLPYTAKDSKFQKRPCSPKGQANCCPRTGADSTVAAGILTSTADADSRRGTTVTDTTLYKMPHLLLSARWPQLYLSGEPLSSPSGAEMVPGKVTASHSQVGRCLQVPNLRVWIFCRGQQRVGNSGLGPTRMRWSEGQK